MGPFDLVRPVGRGAMGEVWLARHRGQGVDVAIKLLHGSTARDDWAVEAFNNEVRAAAGMNHPGIVMVLDHGQVPVDCEVALDGRFPAGTPFLVMELVRGRPMNRFIGVLRWVHVRDVLLQLLDALAHAHARGLVHRDIKPGNVLLKHSDGRVPDPRRLSGPLEAMLTDFGLAQALERQSRADAVVAGTPAYMAPEQLEGRWRDQGPWTDLYAVGCLAWAMVTGAPPFGKERPFEDALYAHIHEDPPPLEPAMPVPPAVELWLRRLLAKDRRDRYPRAADAAWALARLSDSSDRTTGPMTPGARPVPTAEPTDEGLPALQALDLKTLPAPELMRLQLRPPPAPEDEVSDGWDEDDQPTEVTERPAQPTVVARRAPADPTDDRRTPFPTNWRQPRPSPSVRRLDGVGLNLFGLRPPPLVGRVEERTVLWDQLRAVRESGVGRVVVLRGPAGCGRTRLGTWLCQRADEVGAARVLAAVHDPELGKESGLVPMVNRFLRCDGMEGEVLDERLHQLFPDADPLNEELGAISALLASHRDRDTQAEVSVAVRFYYARERFTLIRRLIEREGSEDHGRWNAVVVVWIDDVHLGRDALEFCQFVLDRMDADPLPVLLVLSAQDEGLSARPDEAALLDALCDRDGVTDLPIGPLDEAEHLELIRALLGMESDLVEQIATRTAGSPMFAVQLVGEWVRRGLLEAGDAGFRLRAGAEVEVPADIDRMWRTRVNTLLHGLRPDEVHGLELAAVLGTTFSLSEWRNAATIAEASASPELVERLLEQNLATRQGDGVIAFRHTMLREALERRGVESGRAAALHRACATMLERRSDDRRGIAERLGRHLLHAGQIVPALGKLLEGARERQRSGDPASARRLLDYRERALHTLQLPRKDELWGLGWVARVEIDLQDGRSDAAAVEVQLQRLEAAVARHGWKRVAPGAALLRGLVHLRGGRYPDATTEFAKAASLAELRRDHRLEARALTESASARMRMGDLDLARVDLNDALKHFDSVADLHGRASARWGLGRLAIQEGRLTEAGREIAAARDDFTATGSRWSAAECVNGLGDLARLKGQTGVAEALYRDAIRRMEAVGHYAALIPRINLGLLLVVRKEFVAARRLLEAPLRGVDREANPIVAAAMCMVLLAPVAHAGEWKAWEDYLNTATRILSRTRFVDRDNGLLACIAAEEAIAQGAIEPARSALGLAYQQYQALGMSAELEGVLARVTALGTS